MIEAVYLKETKPDLRLITISIKKVTPMTIELIPKVKSAITEVVDQIFNLTKKLLSEAS